MKLFRRYFPLFLVFFIFAAYANSLFHPFIRYDDAWLVYGPKLLDRLSLSGVWRLLFDFSKATRMDLGAEYLPVRDLIAAVEYLVFRNQVLPYHLVSIALFAGATIILFRAFLLLQVPFRVTAAALLMFAAHPIHSEPLNWLSCLKDLLSFLFFAAAFHAYVASGFKRAIIFFLLALGSKYGAIFFPILLPFIDLALRRPRSIRRYLAFGLLALAAFCVMTFVGETVRYGHLVLGSNVGAIMRNLPVLIHIAVFRLILPLNLQLIYPYVAATSWGDPRIYSGLVLLGLGVFAVVRSFRTHPTMTLLLVLGLSSGGLMLRAPEIHLLADRYLIYPSLTICFVISWLGHGISKKSLSAVAMGSFVLILAFLTVRQNRVWRSDISLWENSAQVEPVHPVVLENLASAYQVSSQHGDARRVLIRLIKNSKLSPQQIESYELNLGISELQLGNIEAAQAAFEKVLEVNSKSSSAHRNLGIALVKQKEFSKAMFHFKEATVLDPDDPEHWFNLALAAIQSDQRELAMECEKRLEVLAAGDPRLTNLKHALGLGPGR